MQGGGVAELLVEKFKGLRVERINNKKEITVQPFNHSTVKLRKHCAFTLAEMMVVMLILTICLAAFAPLMTKKKPLDVSGIWQYAANGSDIYYGLGARNSVMIGQKEKNDNDLDSRLVISNSATDQPHIAFKNGNTNLANLIVKGTNFVFGGPYDNGSNKFSMTGGNNVAIGLNALRANTVGDYNTAIGTAALLNNVGAKMTPAVYGTVYSGSGNTAVGYSALLNNKGDTYTGTPPMVGSFNTAVGYGALLNNTSGNYNVALGNGTLAKNTTANCNVAVGTSALHENSTGIDNTAIGRDALYSNTAGGNTALGAYALQNNTTATNNTAIGKMAMQGVSDITGGFNIAVGREAGKRISSGIENTAIGYGALGAGSSTNGVTGDYNTAVGSFALIGLTSGSNNIAIGKSALTQNTTGSYNTAIGYKACKRIDKADFGITCIGPLSGPGNAQNDILAEGADFPTVDMIYLGHNHSTVYVPGNLVVGGTLTVDNSAYLSTKSGLTWFGVGERGNDATYKGYIWRDDNSNAMYLYTKGRRAYSWNDTTDNQSDRRLKNIKGENKSGLEQIRALQVFDFTFKKDEKKTPHVGVMAQDLQKIFPKAVTKGEDGYLLIRQEDMFYAAINAIKQLDVLVRGLIGELKMAIMKISYHDEQIKQLQKENNELKKSNEELKVRIERLEAKLQ